MIIRNEIGWWRCTFTLRLEVFGLQCSSCESHKVIRRGSVWEMTQFTIWRFLIGADDEYEQLISTYRFHI